MNGAIRSPDEAAAYAQRCLRAALAETEQVRMRTMQLRLKALACSTRADAALFSSAGAFRVHRDVVSGISVGSDRVVTCSWDSSVRVFDLISWQELSPLHVGRGKPSVSRCPILSVALSPCNPGIVGCACRDCCARIWKTDAQSEQELSGHKGAVNDIHFHASQSSVMCTASDDQQVFVWDISLGNRVRALKQHTREVTSACFVDGHAYERVVVTSCADQHVRLWDLRVPSMLCAWSMPMDHRASIASHGTNHILAAGIERRVVVWDLRTRCSLQSFDLDRMVNFTGELTCLAFSPCCSYLAIGSSMGSVFCINLQSRCTMLTQHHSDAISSLAWGSSWPWRADAAPYLTCASFDSTWSCWIPSETLAEPE